MRRTKVVLLMAIPFVMGVFCTIVVMNSPAKKGQPSQSSTAGIMISDDYPNPCVVEFVATKPIAPAFRVARGDHRTADYYLRNDEKQQEWNPLDIDVERTFRLLDEVSRVEGIEVGDISAREYTLRIIIAESHIERKDTITAEVLEILKNFEDDTWL